MRIEHIVIGLIPDILFPPLVAFRIRLHSINIFPPSFWAIILNSLLLLVAAIDFCFFEDFESSSGESFSVRTFSFLS